MVDNGIVHPLKPEADRRLTAIGKEESDQPEIGKFVNKLPASSRAVIVHPEIGTMILGAWKEQSSK